MRLPLGGESTLYFQEMASAKVIGYDFLAGGALNYSNGLLFLSNGPSNSRSWPAGGPEDC